MSDNIISIKTRQVFRDYMAGWVLREISDEFDAAKIECDLEFYPPVNGQRRTLIEQYYHTVNWSDWKDCKRILQVFETALHQAEKMAQEPSEYGQKIRLSQLEKMLWVLGKDGFHWESGRIIAGVSLPLLEEIKTTAVIFDSKQLVDQIRRMESAVESDPSLAIGTAKELIETCCKTILAERGKPISGNPDISALTKVTLKELKLVPEGVSEESRGRDVIKRILSNLGAIGNGLAELRGLYGTGHGKDGKAKGLTPRHAKLAVGAAVTLATFLFETHQENKK